MNVHDDYDYDHVHGYYCDHNGYFYNQDDCGSDGDDEDHDDDDDDIR